MTPNDNIKKFEKMLLEMKHRVESQVEERVDERMGVLQHHVDVLESKMKHGGSVKSVQGSDPLERTIKSNIEKISKAGKDPVKLETKAVGNMTTSNVTGDLPRDYKPGIVTTPGHLVNLVDLIPSYQITGGTYTFLKKTGGEGSFDWQTTENTDKSQIDYDFTATDVSLDFLAAFTVYSRKMATNMIWLEQFLPQQMKQDFMVAQNNSYYTTLTAGITASTEVKADHKTKAAQIMKEIGKLEDSGYAVNGIAVRPSDWYEILSEESSTGSGFTLPGSVHYSAGQLMVNGVPVHKCQWVASDKYIVGDWTVAKEVFSGGLNLEFSDSDEDSFRRNNIVARLEKFCALAIEDGAGLVFGDFEATA